MKTASVITLALAVFVFRDTSYIKGYFRTSILWRSFVSGGLLAD